MLIEESISYNDAWATASLTSPYIDITDYKKLVIKYYSKKTTGNNGDKYSPKIYLQNSGGSNVKTIYNHAQTQHASYYSGTIEVDLSSYTGNHRLQLVFSGYGNAVSANAGAMICLSEATLSKK